MAEPLSLLEFVQRLAGDGDLRGDFTADPHGVLADHGLDGLPPQDVHDALVLVEDTRTIEYHPDHVVDLPSFDVTGPDALVQYLAGHAGLPTDHTGFDVDGAGDIDDLDGYAVPAPQHPIPDDAEPHVGGGFGHGTGPAVDRAVEPGTDLHQDGDLSHHEPDVQTDPHTSVDPAFDEPGSYDEFGTEPAFDHSHGFDHQVDEPGHPG
jgi:hypothetical protein